MSLQVWGERLVTADFTSTPTYYQKFTPTESIALKAIRAWLVFFNTPTFTSIAFRIYSLRDGALASLLYTSDVNASKSNFTANAYGVLEGYYSFSSPPFLKGGDTYGLVLWINGYTGDENSHIAWVKRFPDLVYDNEQSVTDMNSIASNAPYDFTMVFSEL